MLRAGASPHKMRVHPRMTQHFGCVFGVQRGAAPPEVPPVIKKFMHDPAI